MSFVELHSHGPKNYFGNKHDWNKHGLGKAAKIIVAGLDIRFLLDLALTT